MNTSPIWTRWMLTIALGLLPFSALSALVTYRAGGTFVSSDFPSQIASGDQYVLEFTLDTSALDRDTRDAWGEFPNALVSLNFRLNPDASIGSYSGGSATRGTVSTVDQTRFYVWNLAGTFEPLGGFPFGGLLLVLDDPSFTSSIDDPGGIPSLAEVLRGPLDLNEFSDTLVRLGPVDKHGTAEAVVTSLVVVPEPGVSLILFVGLGATIRRRTRIQN